MTALDYTRQRDWFDPSKVRAGATIVGCGGIGSFTALALAKLGVQQLDLIDFDRVEQHNVPNQMFAEGQVGMPKVDALASVLGIWGPGANIIPHNVRLEDVHAWPLVKRDVVVSALDSMEARAALWERVRNQIGVKLFIDARLGGQHVVVYQVRPTDPDDIRGYEATLHSDEEGMDLPCTGRSIIDVGFAVASLITRAVRAQYANESPQPVTYLNQETLDIMKGGWS